MTELNAFIPKNLFVSKYQMAQLRLINVLPERFTKFIMMRKTFSIPEFFKMVLNEEQFATYTEIYNQNVDADFNADGFPVDFNYLVDKTGGSRKDSAKRKLLSILKENEHYQISTSMKTTCNDVVEVSHKNVGNLESSDEGGRPTEIIKLSYEGAQIFCLKAKDITYAETFTAILRAVTDFHRLSAYIDPLLFRNNELKNLYRKQNVVYLALVVVEGKKTLVKIGESDDIFDRKNGLQTEYGCIYLLDVFPVLRSHDCEQEILHSPDVAKRIYKDTILGKLHTEVMELDDSYTYNDLLKLVQSWIKTYNDDTFNQERIELFKLQNERDKIQNEKEKIQNEKEKIELLKKNGPEFMKCLEMNELLTAAKSESESESEGTPSSSTTVYKPKIKSRKNSRGYFIQQIDENDFTKIIAVYESALDATRELKLKGTESSKSRILSSMNSDQPYLDSRWIKVTNDQDRTISHCKTPNAHVQKQKVGLVAKLTKDGSKIKAVFNTQLEAMEEAQLNSRGSISNAIKNCTLCVKHLYKMWEDCSLKLREEYELVHGKQKEKRNGNGVSVNQLDPISKTLIQKHSNIESIVEDFGIGRIALNSAIKSQEPLKGYLWTRDL